MYLAARRAAYAADNAYSAELVRLFGKIAGDARYDARGKSTPVLRTLSAAMLAASDAMHSALLVMRAAGASVNA